MAASNRGLKRKSYFVDENMVQRAKKLLRAETDSDAVRISLERLVENEEFWQFMDDTAGALDGDSFERP
ncbi:MAG TPA: hypothetical protein PK156_40905 [Polyangium sp.]|nr:hypothetical protein [Polyangium sp.]